MAAKWFKEYDTRERVIDMIVREHFLTMLPEDIHVWVKEHKPETSVIAGKLAEDYQQARKTAEDDQTRSKEKPSKGGKRCLVCHKTGHLARDCSNRTYKKNVRSTEGYHNITTRDEFSAVLRCFTCNGKGHTSKQCPVRHYFMGIRIS